MKIPLSVLEFGYIDPPNLHAYQTINHLFEEVSILEEIGYKRLWLSEHYSPEFAWFNPEMLLPLLAGYSNSIKIGLAGILLSYHSPLRVAQNFKVLSAIYPDRIDLGIARAFVPDNTSKYLIAEEEKTRINGEWDVKVQQLIDFLRQDDPKTSLIDNIIVPPHGTSLPEVWSLGVSDSSIPYAVNHKCNYCISMMHPGSNYKKNIDTLKTFKNKYFDLHRNLPTTAVLLCFAELINSDEISRLNTRYNPDFPINLFGERDFIRERLWEIKEELGNDEFILFNPFSDRNRRLEMYSSIIRD